LLLGSTCAVQEGMSALGHKRTNAVQKTLSVVTVTQISEPSFDEMMKDQIIRALMVADGVEPRELRQLLRLIAEKLRWRKLRTGKKSAVQKRDDERAITYRQRWR
jgi:hypothetical protein